MTKRFNFPPEFFKTRFTDENGFITPEAQLILQTSMNGDNLPDGNARQQTKASNLLASDIPTNSDFEEFNDTGVVAYAWEGQWDDAGTTTLTRDFYRPSTSAFRGSKCQMLISPDNVRGSSIASQPFAVKPFLQWHPSVWAKSDAALPAGAKGFRCRIAWFNGNSDFSKTGAASFTDVVLGADTTLSTAFQEFAADVTVPASARFARMVLYNHGPSKGSNFASNILVDTTSWGLVGLSALDTVTGTTSAPTHAGAFATIDEMTKTRTCRGGAVFCLFCGSIQSDNLAGNSQAFFDITMDGVSISGALPETFVVANQAQIVIFAAPVVPSAGSHTFAARWRTDAGQTLTATLTFRKFHVFEVPG
jgi:hypothetical protein